jgi:hypothetical protein
VREDIEFQIVRLCGDRRPSSTVRTARDSGPEVRRDLPSRGRVNGIAHAYEREQREQDTEEEIFFHKQLVCWVLMIIFFGAKIKRKDKKNPHCHHWQ